MNPIACGASAADTSDQYIPNILCRVEQFGLYGLPTPYDMNDFWNACRPWMASRGINLFGLQDSNPNMPSLPKWWSLPATVSTTGLLPYSHFRHREDCDPIPIFPCGSRLACAQDLKNRNLMIKLVDNGSVEHTVYQAFYQEEEYVYSDNASFPCVLPPVAILDTPHEYSFVVMPMWGRYVHLKHMQSLGEVLRCIECLLKGLTYLHRNRIAHRDICEMNMVVNFHSPAVSQHDYLELLREHRLNGRDTGVFYAFMDYDQSLQLPLETSLQECRRPSPETMNGDDMYKPEDTNLGKPYYNPFAYDVGMLGRLFRRFFAEAVGELPGLAALFDRMSDHSVSRRFTAEQALQFFESITTDSELSYDTFKIPLTLKSDYEAMRNADMYWSKLSAEDVSRWGVYRTPPRSRLVHILDWILDHKVVWRAVTYIRRVLRM